MYILEIILAFVVGAIVGGFVAIKILPGFLKSIFRDTATDALTEATQEVRGEQDQYEKDIATALKELGTALNTATTTWKTNTESLTNQVGDLIKSHTQWAEALSNPQEQGALAEESLKVMLETAGFTKDINFKLQKTETTDEGKKVRPDVYVYTPDEGVIIIDSKAPMKLFREAIEMDNEEQKQKKFKKHAKKVLDHAKKLGKKDYTQVVGNKTPDFVIMYMPNVAVYMSAVDQIPDLVEQAAKNRVMICPPALVYAALKTIMLNWQQKKMYENAALIENQAKVIHHRLHTFIDHFKKSAKNLRDANKNYNKSISSWNHNLMPAFRTLEDMGVADKTRELEHLDQIEEEAHDD